MRRGRRGKKRLRELSDTKCTTEIWTKTYGVHPETGGREGGEGEDGLEDHKEGGTISYIYHKYHNL